jgi:two-component system NtrC family response regulator
LGASRQSVTFTDISDEKASLLNQVLLNIADGLIVLDINGRIIFASKGAKRITGFNTGELLRMGFCDIVPDKVINEICEKRGCSKEGLNMFHVFVTRKTDEKRCLSFHVSNAPDGMKIVSFRDVTRQKELERWVNESERHNQKSSMETEAVQEMIGSSPAIKNIFSVIRKLATVDLPVLIMGESGTGKELTAQAIHKRSKRKDGPFIAINCGAIPETLLESELFGYKKGAFTGADFQKKGRIEDAENGTLFLDEVGELSLPLQVKLLRFLQDHKLQRLGSRKDTYVNCRVMAATNTDLEKAVASGRFRRDLYHRLNAITVTMPPLKDRGEDVILMAKTFLERFSKGKKYRGFTAEAMDAMINHSWPGNVREIINRIKRAAIMAEGEWISCDDLGLKDGEKGLTLREARERVERELIAKAVYKHRKNISKACKELGTSRTNLYNLLRKHGIT